MSRSLRSLRSLNAISSSSSVSFRSATASAARNYSMTAMKEHPDQHYRSSSQRIQPRSRPSSSRRYDNTSTSTSASSFDRRPPSSRYDELSSEKNEWNGPKSNWKEAPELVEHLNAIFPELHFPMDLAKRILTHGSHPSAIYGHNGALSFMGRRVMESYLLLLLTPSPSLKKTHIPDEIISRTLNPYSLGEFVGSKWGLGRTMRWTPAMKANMLSKDADQREMLRNVGLYKVQGDAVSAVVGGVFFQFGASVAHRLFHTRILPLLVNRSLPKEFTDDAQEACQRLGGEKGKLLLLETSTSHEEAERLVQPVF